MAVPGKMQEMYARSLSRAETLWADSSRMPERPDGDLSFGKYIAQLLTRKDEQAAAITIYAQSGMGKSTVAITCAQEIGKYLAEIRGDTLADHFTRKNMAVLSEEESRRIMRHASEHKFQIYIIDEVADDTNARKSMTNDNVDKAKIAAIIRTSRSCIIRCVQFKSMMDKQIRNQATFEIQIVEAHHDEGYNVCKIKRVVAASANGDPYTPYMTVNNNGRDRIIRHVIPAPYLDTEMYENYKNDRRTSANKTILGISEGRSEVEKVSARELTKQKCENAWALFQEHTDWSWSRCARKAGVDPHTFERWAGNAGLSFERVKESV